MLRPSISDAPEAPPAGAVELGQRLARSCWRATVAGPRLLAVAGLSAAVWHAFVPAIAFGTYAAAFIVAECFARGPLRDGERK